MQKKKDVDVIIIGAGLTGLTAAWLLKKHGYDAVILEKNNRTGGVIETIREEGFVYEAGPNTGVLSHPEAVELFEDLAGHCRLEVANPEAKRRLIWKSGRWHALPGSLMSAIKTPLFTAGDKLRILGEPFRPKGTDQYETLANLVVRRLGRSYLDYAVDPFISGIYAGDPAELVTRFALPRLYALEQNHGSFIMGAVKKSFEPRDERIRKATKEVFSAEGGLGSLTGGLSSVIGADRIYLNRKNTSVRPGKDGFLVTTQDNGSTTEMTAQRVITTVDAGLLPALLPFMTETELAPVTNLVYSGVVQVILGFKNWKGIALNAFGGLVPSMEKRNILGVLFTSSFLKNRAPEGGALLSVFLGGARRPDLVALSDPETRKLVSEELQDMLGISNPDPDIFRIFRYKRAIPQYGVSSGERLGAIDTIRDKYPGLILAGNIRDGIGMADRIRQAGIIVGRIVDEDGRS